MPEQEKEPHLAALEGSDFERAKELYGTLLSSDPDNVEYLCGFYTAGYWLNRKEVKTRKRPGRGLASWLTAEWDAFEAAAHERDFTGALSFRAVMRGILREAADNFRTAFQEEGS
ncbi:MAG: hypothetical protein HY042_01510, partial [Spirochaetia bacterium]|nr:hypothetical protein [Spirochaetia bacterium]